MPMLLTELQRANGLRAESQRRASLRPRPRRRTHRRVRAGRPVTGAARQRQMRRRRTTTTTMPRTRIHMALRMRTSPWVWRRRRRVARPQSRDRRREWTRRKMRIWKRATMERRRAEVVAAAATKPDAVKSRDANGDMPTNEIRPIWMMLEETIPSKQFIKEEKRFEDYPRISFCSVVKHHAKEKSVKDAHSFGHGRGVRSPHRRPRVAERRRDRLRGLWCAACAPRTVRACALCVDLCANSGA